jgi:hypothetical protein
MSKKKNPAKKHKFKHVDTAMVSAAAEVSASSNGSQGSAPASTLQTARAAAAGTARDFSYVGQDLRRIGVMAGALVALEMVLYYVMVYTPVGATIYSLVKV